MARFFASIAVLGIFLAAEQAAGQSALERLEREIRDRLAGPQSAPQQVAPAVKDGPAGPPPAKAGPPPAGRGQAYFGALAVDALERGRGVRVTEVAPGSPAHTAGIQPGDLLTGLGGVRIRTLQDFDEIMQEVCPGMTLTMELLRGKEPRKLNVTFAGPPEAKRPAGLPVGQAKPKPDEALLPVAPPPKAAAADGASPTPKPSALPPSAPKIPAPPPEPARAEVEPSHPVVGQAARGLPALTAPETAKGTVPAGAGDTEARLAGLEARLRELEERVARLEEALRQVQAAKAEP